MCGWYGMSLKRNDSEGWQVKICERPSNTNKNLDSKLNNAIKDLLTQKTGTRETYKWRKQAEGLPIFHLKLEINNTCILARPSRGVYIWQRGLEESQETINSTCLWEAGGVSGKKNEGGSSLAAQHLIPPLVSTWGANQQMEDFSLP